MLVIRAVVLLLGWSMIPAPAAADRFGPPWMSRVSVDQTTVHAEPTADSAVVGGLAKDALVVVLDQRADWTRVSDGWLRSAEVVETSSPWMAEVTQDTTVHAKPDAQSDRRRTANPNDLLLVTGVSHGVDGDQGLWWATTEGFVALSSVKQAAIERANDWTLPTADDALNGWWGTAEPARVRSAPSISAPVLGEFRGGERVKVLSERTGEDVDGNATWYRIDGGRYPGAYVHASLVERATEPQPTVVPPPDGRQLGDEPWIVIDRAAHTLTLLRDGQPVFTTHVTLGKAGKDTPAGAYATYLKYAADRMTSTSVPDAERSYNLPNVPFVQYFKDDGSAIHGTYWHDAFGTDESQGCINLTWSDSAYLFRQTQPPLADGQNQAQTSIVESTPVVILN